MSHVPRPVSHTCNDCESQRGRRRKLRRKMMGRKKKCSFLHKKVSEHANKHL